MPKPQSTSPITRLSIYIDMLELIFVLVFLFFIVRFDLPHEWLNLVAIDVVLTIIYIIAAVRILMRLWRKRSSTLVLIIPGFLITAILLLLHSLHYSLIGFQPVSWSTDFGLSLVVIPLLFALSMVHPTWILLQAIDPLSSMYRRIRSHVVLSMLMFGLGPAMLLALPRSTSTELNYFMSFVGLIAGLMPLLWVWKTMVDVVKSGEEGEKEALLMKENIRTHLCDVGLAQVFDDASPWLVDGDVSGVWVRVRLSARQVPYRLHIKISVPGLSDEFSLSTRGKSVGGKIGDVLLDSVFCIEGASPQQVRVLYGLHAQLMALLGESVLFEIRSGWLVVEHPAEDRDDGFVVLDDAIAVARQLSQPGRAAPGERPVPVAAPRTERPGS